MRAWTSAPPSRARERFYLQRRVRGWLFQSSLRGLGLPRSVLHPGHSRRALAATATTHGPIASRPSSRNSQHSHRSTAMRSRRRPLRLRLPSDHLQRQRCAGLDTLASSSRTALEATQVASPKPAHRADRLDAPKTTHVSGASRCVSLGVSRPRRRSRQLPNQCQLLREYQPKGRRQTNYRALLQPTTSRPRERSGFAPQQQRLRRRSVLL